MVSDITLVYIGNPANHDTQTIGYQPEIVNRWMMEVDDMATGVLERPPSSPTQFASFAKKVQTIIRRCMVSIGSTLGCTLSQHSIQQTFPVQPSRRHPRKPVLKRGAHGVKRGARRLPPARHVKDALLPLLIWANEDIQNPNVEEREFGFGATCAVTSKWIGHLPSGTVGSSFQAPSSPGIAGLSTPHMPISYASLSDSDEHDDERTDDVTPTQQLGFGHHVGEKTTRFTPSDWP
ncbi:hypothetical protein M9H77_29700 [Catharanthus roseus]|uniref:Uncharacterized protein n=1 Tax=Catharanthus roseus TaxID=4058 RepID=A0ACB9ZV62_CATRO|nr:hypothetical protein M9H77_29700 [Catharanthus roseus]